MAKAYVRQSSLNRSASLPCGPVCMEAEYNKLMCQDEPSSPTSEIMEDGFVQGPPSRRGHIFVVASMVFIFMAIIMCNYSKDGFWLATKKKVFMYK
ncbi:hypothetical protein HanRHA438_Chr07g0305101 [Helianthus annuus]|nr:hypothetical protein HanRHA438_Chr07g0305101 [Helianthus annuus]